MRRKGAEERWEEERYRKATEEVEEDKERGENVMGDYIYTKRQTFVLGDHDMCHVKYSTRHRREMCESMDKLDIIYLEIRLCIQFTLVHD